MQSLEGSRAVGRDLHDLEQGEAQSHPARSLLAIHRSAASPPDEGLPPPTHLAENQARKGKVFSLRRHFAHPGCKGIILGKIS